METPNETDLEEKLYIEDADLKLIDERIKLSEAYFTDPKYSIN